MTTMTITRCCFSTPNVGDVWNAYRELYFVPSRPCMTKHDVCGCNGPQTWFALDECEPFNGDPISVINHEVHPNRDEILIYDRASVIDACPAGMVPAEVVLEAHTDGVFVYVQNFL